MFQAQQLAYGFSHLTPPSSSKGQTLVHWHFPPDGFIKLNCDGSVLASKTSACGGLIRDSSGFFCGGFVANLGICPITVAEIWAVYYSLYLAWQKGFRRILLESDSSSALSLIQKDSIDRHPFASIVKHVRDLLSRDWEVHILHIFCEGNRAADFLANIGHIAQLGVCFYDSVPNGLAS